jgi:hypothetical protein
MDKKKLLAVIGKAVEAINENEKLKQEVLYHAKRCVQAEKLLKENEAFCSVLQRNEIKDFLKSSHNLGTNCLLDYKGAGIMKGMQDIEKHGKVHYLKTLTPFFNDIVSGIKTFEVRKNDRYYEVGDTLILEDFDPDTQKYKRGWVSKQIIYKLDDRQFVKEGYVILGMQDIKI